MNIVARSEEQIKGNLFKYSKIITCRPTSTKLGIAMLLPKDFFRYKRRGGGGDRFVEVHAKVFKGKVLVHFRMRSCIMMQDKHFSGDA